MKDVDRATILIDRVDDPILGSTAHSKQICPIRRARKREVALCQRRFAKIGRQDAIEPVYLLNGELLAVFAQICRKFFDVVLRTRSDTQAKWHKFYRFLPR